MVYTVTLEPSEILIQKRCCNSLNYTGRRDVNFTLGGIHCTNYKFIKGIASTVEFDTKIALVIRNDLELWQKLNVTAFLTSGIVGTTEGIMGEAYRDADGSLYHPLVIQPMIILAATTQELTRTCQRAASRELRVAVYIEDMFTTGHDDANRAAVSAYSAAELPLVGLSMRGERKVVDKVSALV